MDCTPYAWPNWLDPMPTAPIGGAFSKSFLDGMRGVDIFAVVNCRETCFHPLSQKDPDDSMCGPVCDARFRIFKFNEACNDTGICMK